MPTDHEVANFIRASFRSVWSLELLRHLRENRARSLGHQEMVASLRGSDLVVTQSLEMLAAAGLIVVEADGAARYMPVGLEADALVEAAEALYAKSPDNVRRMIISASNPSLSAFADAFRLKRD